VAVDRRRWIEPDVIAAARGQLAPAQFEREYLGEFADVGIEERVIERTWVEDATARSLEPGQPVIGVDVARHGGDESVCVLLLGGVARILWTIKGADLMTVAGRVAQTAQAVEADHGATPPVWIDAIGLGAGVFDRCRELGVDAREFIASARASDSRRYLNLRAQAWWETREALRRGEIDLPDDRTLAGQLAAVRYGIAASGALQIASKDSMKTSPDRADALVIACHARAMHGDAERMLAQARMLADGSRVEEDFLAFNGVTEEQRMADEFDGRPRSWRDRLDGTLPSFGGQW
jgi:hypothetical protein